MVFIKSRISKKILLNIRTNLYEENIKFDTWINGHDLDVTLNVIIKMILKMKTVYC